VSRSSDDETAAALRTDDFDFDLPREAIADRPAVPRDAARMLVIGEMLRDMSVRDLPDLLATGDVLVINDTRVIPARLIGRRGEARIEVTLHRPEGPRAWRAFARPARRLKPGDAIVFAPDFTAEVVDKRDGGEVVLAFAEDDRLRRA
jgi:S-adenosylmethionine:tRNA ribosyltransferase-isomerase